MTEHLGHLAVRPVNAGDDDFLTRLYASTRADLLHLPVPRNVAMSIIRHQQQMQRAGYAGDFPHAQYLLLEHEGAPVGRLVIDSAGGELRVVDLAIAPEARRRGHAAAALRALQQQAGDAGTALALRVRKDNAAARALYAGLGFVAAGGDELAEQMRWTRAVPAPATRRHRE